MNCPNCGCPTSVVDSGVIDNVVMRKRVCKKCRKRFSTVEKVFPGTWSRKKKVTTLYRFTPDFKMEVTEKKDEYKIRRKEIPAELCLNCVLPDCDMKKCPHRNSV